VTVAAALIAALTVLRKDAAICSIRNAKKQASVLRGWRNENE